MSSYRALLARPGARGLVLSCGLGWLSFAGYGLAIVLAVQSATGSFAVAGAAVAAFSTTAALLAPMRGRCVDRRGPRALAWFALPHSLALTGLVAGCAWSRSPLLLTAAAGLAGAVVPPLIATARSVWPQVSGPQLVRTGHAVNAAVGDGAQVLGPVLIAAVAALASPLVALGLLVPGAAIAAILVVRVAPAPAASVAGLLGAGGARGWGALRESRGLRTLVLCELALGTCLGALEVAAPALADRAGAAELGAAPLTLFAAGSIVLSLWSGTGRSARRAPWRYLAGVVIVALALPLCLVVPSLAGLTAVAFFAGAGYGLITVALFELLDDVVAGHRAVEALTWLTSAQGAGLAAGAAGAGQLAHAGASAALLLVALPATLAAVIALSRRATLAGGAPRDRRVRHD